VRGTRRYMCVGKC